jgi:hypothetical protein
MALPISRRNPGAKGMFTGIVTDIGEVIEVTPRQTCGG